MAREPGGIDPEALAFADLHSARIDRLAASDLRAARLSPAVREALNRYRLPREGVDPMALAQSDLDELRQMARPDRPPQENPNQGIEHEPLIKRPQRGVMMPMLTEG